jgi:ribosomal protein L40E
MRRKVGTMADKNPTRPCPNCREDIPEDATLCRHCGLSALSTKPNHEGTCPFCRSDIKPDATVCRYCHSHVGNSGPHTVQAAFGNAPARLTGGSRLVDVTPPFELPPPEGVQDGVPLALGCGPCGYASGNWFQRGVLTSVGAGERSCHYLVCTRWIGRWWCRVETRTEPCDFVSEALFG